MNPHTDLDIFAPTVDLPDDSDLVNPAAATLNVPADGELDRSFYLHNRLAGALACSWGPRIDPGATVQAAAFFSNSTGSLGLGGGYWWATDNQDTDKIRQTADWGATWSDVTVGLDTLACNDIDFDPSGNAVVPNNGSTTVYDYTIATGVWAHHTAVLTGTVHLPRVRYEPNLGIWLIFYNDTATGMNYFSSNDRVSWFSGSLPPAFTGAGTFTPHMGAGGGGFVVAFRSSSTHVQIAAGSGLGTGFQITTAMTSVTDCSDPVYSDEDSAWLIALYGVAGGHAATEFYKSLDGGLTWALVTTLSGSHIDIQQIANVGHLWVGISTTGLIVYSLDIGLHWRLAPMQATDPTATHRAMWAGGGGLMVLDYGGFATGSRATSIRLGNHLAPVLT